MDIAWIGCHRNGSRALVQAKAGTLTVLAVKVAVNMMIIRLHMSCDWLGLLSYGFGAFGNNIHNQSVFAIAPGEGIIIVETLNGANKKEGLGASNTGAHVTAASVKKPNITVAEFIELSERMSPDKGELGYGTDYGYV